jgi:hypothetical protein
MNIPIYGMGTIFSDWYRPFWVINLTHNLAVVKCFYLCGCFCGLSLWIPISWIHVEYMDHLWTRLAQKQVAVGEYPTSFGASRCQNSGYLGYPHGWKTIQIPMIIALRQLCQLGLLNVGIKLQ